MPPFNHNDNCTGSVCFCDDYNKQIEHLHNNSITEEIKRLKAENARYREALEEVISEGCSDLCQNMKRYRPSYTCHVEIAREALKGGE